jgi:threonine dehydratase
MPDCKVFGVEPYFSASYTAALAANKPVETLIEPTLADGLAVPKVGSHAFQMARHYVDDTFLTTEREIAIACLRLIENEKLVVEGGGAIGLTPILPGGPMDTPEWKGKVSRRRILSMGYYLSLSFHKPNLLAHLSFPLPNQTQNVVVPICGGNIDTTTLGRVIDRGLAADQRLVRFVATVSDRPGGIARLTSLLAAEEASVKDIYHERSWLQSSVSNVQMRCVLELRGREHAQRVKEALAREGYPTKWDDTEDPLNSGDIKGTECLPVV